MKVLQEQGYQFGLFSGNGFNEPLYSEVIFRNQNLATQIEAEKNTEQAVTHSDAQAVDAWNEWLLNQAKSPWFSYIEVTELDNIETASLPTTANASDKFKQAYDVAVRQADSTLQRIFATLDEQQLSDNTVVIITSNHGSEFNETQTNSWGANSNYSRYQLQVPMVIHWPGKLPAQFGQSTSHLDLSVTLLQDLMGVASNPADFSSGRNLFDESKRRWILAGDTREIALITPNQTTVIDKFGNFKLYDNHYQRVRDDSPKLPVLMQGLTELQRFYAKSN